MQTAKEIGRLIERLEAGRKVREARLIKLARYICPWRGRFAEREKRDPYGPRETELFTAVASDAVLRGASGMTSGMTPRNISWFKPVFTETSLMELTGSREWLDEMDKRIKETLYGGGFYQAIQNFNIDLLWSGAGLLYTEVGRENVMDFYCPQPGSYIVQTNTKGWLEAAGRRVSMTAFELAERFGEASLSQKTRRLLALRPHEPVAIWHLALRLPKPDGLKTVRSFYLEEGVKDRFLHVGGFHEMPYFFATWNEGATPYGTGPGDNCLADAMQMDELERAKLEGMAKLVNPPMLVPPELKDTLDLSPGAINFVSGNPTARPIIDLSPYAQSLGNIQGEILAVSQRLEKGLMAAVFSSMPLDQRPAGMSATEFLERKRDALQQLGPIMSAYEPLVLTPLLTRVANTLQREGFAPEEPDSLKEIKNVFMRMDFISPMANALRQTGAETTRALATDIASLAQACQSPELLDKLNTDQIADELANGLGAPGSILRSDDEVAQIRKQRAEAQAQAQAMQAQAQAAQGAGMGAGAQGAGAGA